MATWGVAEAKAKFSEVIDQAVHHGPQTITRHGVEEVVVVSKKEWDAKARPRKHKNLAEFFLNSPLRGSGIKIERIKASPRPVKF
ncbi:MAG: type II toxin-antitoxin system Phd/YefM family antitoxin [Acidobacteria bacterium]|nr:type II toxin-antitoxin system Phd/YefM family antitoxin [Acidobacteriota bacterium]